MFGFALNQNEKDVTAWWWLARVLDDPHLQDKALEKARACASEDDQSLAIYRSLLQEAGEPVLPRDQLGTGSGSLRETCLFCSSPFEIGDTIVACPVCALVHHAECWEGSAYHCARYACNGSALVNYVDPVPTQAPSQPVQTSTVVLEQEDIPEETPYLAREEQEANFMDRMRRRAFAAMAADFMRQQQVAQQREIAIEQARQEAERQQMAAAQRIGCALLVGLVPGILLSIEVFNRTGSWWMALFTVFLTATAIANSVGHALETTDRFTTIIYWLIPRIATAVILFAAFDKWGKGWLAVMVAYLGGIVFIERIFRMRPFYTRRAFIVYSILAIMGLILIRTLVQ